MRPRRSLECFWFITAVGCHAHLERLAGVKQLKGNTGDTLNVSSHCGPASSTNSRFLSSDTFCFSLQPLSQIAPCSAAEILLSLDTFVLSECKNMDKSQQTVVNVTQRCFVLTPVTSNEHTGWKLCCVVVQTRFSLACLNGLSLKASTLLYNSEADETTLELCFMCVVWFNLYNPSFLIRFMGQTWSVSGLAHTGLNGIISRSLVVTCLFCTNESKAVACLEVNNLEGENLVAT